MRAVRTVKMLGVELVACINRIGYIGKGGELLYSIKEDMKRFKEITRGGIVIMGYKTYAEIGGGLPGRKNYIIAREGHGITEEGVEVRSSLEEVYQDLDGLSFGERKGVYIIGGAKLYNEALGKGIVSKLHITIVGDNKEGDAKIDLELVKRGYRLTSSIGFVGLDRKSGERYGIDFNEYEIKR